MSAVQHTRQNTHVPCCRCEEPCCNLAPRIHDPDRRHLPGRRSHMSKKLSRWALACVLLSALPLLLAACGSSSSGATTTAGTVAIPSKPESGTITMTTQPWIGYGMGIVAQKKGFFRTKG